MDTNVRRVQERTGHGVRARGGAGAVRPRRDRLPRPRPALRRLPARGRAARRAGGATSRCASSRASRARSGSGGAAAAPRARTARQPLAALDARRSSALARRAGAMAATELARLPRLRRVLPTLARPGATDCRTCASADLAARGSYVPHRDPRRPCVPLQAARRRPIPPHWDDALRAPGEPRLSTTTRRTALARYGVLAAYAAPGRGALRSSTSAAASGSAAGAITLEGVGFTSVTYGIDHSQAAIARARTLRGRATRFAARRANRRRQVGRSTSSSATTCSSQPVGRRSASRPSHGRRECPRRRADRRRRAGRAGTREAVVQRAPPASARLVVVHELREGLLGRGRGARAGRGDRRSATSFIG